MPWFYRISVVLILTGSALVVLSNLLDESLLAVPATPPSIEVALPERNKFVRPGANRFTESEQVMIVSGLTLRQIPTNALCEGDVSSRIASAIIPLSSYSFYCIWRTPDQNDFPFK